MNYPQAMDSVVVGFLWDHCGNNVGPSVDGVPRLRAEVDQRQMNIHDLSLLRCFVVVEIVVV